MTPYFTDREFGLRSRTVGTIDGRVWGGLHSLIATRLSNGSFGCRFPQQCPDGYGACGCDDQVFCRVLAAEVPSVAWPVSAEEGPDTPIILDLLEFCATAVGEPIERSYHPFYRHHHLSWDREAGLKRFVADVNLIFSRNGIAYELTAEGQARRLLPQPLAETLSRVQFNTGDTETDRLLESARVLIASPKPGDRRDAIEKLWDGFERLKTLELGSDKKAQVGALLDRVAPPGSRFRQALAEEAKALTEFGNSFRIRHSEASQELLTAPEQNDYLFMRMFAFIHLVLEATGRSG